jgi:hypothetical protein
MWQDDDDSVASTNMCKRVKSLRSAWRVRAQPGIGHVFSGASAAAWRIAATALLAVLVGARHSLCKGHTPLVPEYMFYTHARTYTHTHTHTHTHTRAHVFMYIYMHACMHACIHPCMHAYIHPSIHPYNHLSIHPSIHTYLHTYIHRRRACAPPLGSACGAALRLLTWAGWSLACQKRPTIEAKKTY